LDWNAAETVQRFIDEVLRGFLFVYAYIDDVLVASDSVDKHAEHLHLLFARFSHYEVVISPTKCQFGVTTLTFRVHMVNVSGISPLPETVKTVQGFPSPTSLHKLRKFLGLVNFY